MYVVSLTPSGAIGDVYDPEAHIDPGVEVFPITDEEFHKIYASGDLGLWKREAGRIVPNTTELNARKAAQVRAERDRRLTATDWTQLADIPTATRTKWAAYRQSLRDVPQQPAFPHEISWPVKP